MTRNSTASALAVVVIATILKLVFNAVSDNGVAWDYPSLSEGASRMKGVYVCSVQVTPVSILWQGNEVSIEKAWIERQVHTSYPFIWGWRREPSGNDLLCFTLKKGRQVFMGADGPFFRSESIRYSGSLSTFKSSGELCFNGELKPDAQTSHAAEMRLVKDWQDVGADRIN